MASERWTLDLLSFVLGVLAAGILGRIFTRIALERGQIQRPYKKMAVYTDQTPDDVFQAARGAFWRLLGWYIVLGISLVIIGSLVYYLSISEQMFYF